MTIETKTFAPKINSIRTTGSPCAWRFIVLPNRSQAGKSEATVARIDQAHRLEESHLLNWTEQIIAPKCSEGSLGEPIDCGFAFDGGSYGNEINYGPGMATASVPAAGAQLAGTHLQLKAMLAEAAHDIRAPIGVARQILHRISSQVRQRGTLGPNDIGLIDSAHERLEQATSWVDGILLPNRLSKSHEVTIRQRFYPHQVLSLIRPNVQILAAKRDVQLQWDGWDRSLPRLYLDANQLGRVLQNLITNAIEASPPGASVTVRAAWQTNVTQRLVIAIEDESRGLSESMLRYINSTDNQPLPSEVGIGLQTVKRLMRACGSISAQTVPRGGTLFRLTLPVDNRLSLVRGWLLQNAQPAKRHSTAALRTITLHLIRSSGMDVARVDNTLQQQSAQGDLVYRVSDDRWLWLALDGDAAKMRALASIEQLIESEQISSGQLYSQLMIEWPNINLAELLSASDERHLLPQLAKAITRKFDELAGSRIPPIDQLQSNLGNRNSLVMQNPPSRRVDSPASKRVLRVDSPLARKTQDMRLDESNSESTQSINLLTTDPSIFSRISLNWDESDASD